MNKLPELPPRMRWMHNKVVAVGKTAWDKDGNETIAMVYKTPNSYEVLVWQSE